MRGDLNRHGMRGWTRKKEEGRVACWSPVLAQRARSEGARSTRALEDQPGCPLKR